MPARFSRTVTLPLKGLLAVALLALAFVGAAARPAAAATPCWKLLLNDWYDGRIDHTYPIACYDAALKHLPTDVQQYSSARDDIERALLDAKARDRSAGRAESPTTLVPAQPSTTTRRAAAPPPTGGMPPSGPTQPAAATRTLPTTAPLPGNQPHGGLARVAERLNPASPTSLPVPMLVLGGLAIALVAAGVVGAFVRRSQQGN